ncbi:hypothetical protein L2E82_46177 [Cichorium intybus]|uniref:Uncharacterized protein n=1 Tax=Cichorium intybus TaxID=13427 RepID=A0ACB8YS41_CICIN|nr:hypothetical protein L2E82_46177 [Cichorium intybus]
MCSGPIIAAHLRIVDESHGISIIFFAETFEKPPRVESAGDIIQLSNVMARLHESEVNAVCYKQFSSFALYKGIDGSSFVPYQVSSKFHGREQDNKFISNLRNWAFSRQHGTEKSAKELDSVICKVVHICEVREGEWMVFVWDGTDAPPLNVEGRLEEELKNPIPLQLEASPLSREVLCGFPSVGTVLRMTTDPRSERQLGLHTLKAATGKWVHFKNIKFEVCCVNMKNGIKADGLACHGRASLSFLVSQVMYKFRCVVRVVATFPAQPSDFRGPCSNYMLRLTLEDPTARIHAYLYDEYGEKFFGGYPSNDKMIKLHNTLLGVEETNGITNEKPRNPPWVDCCLQSYYVDKNDVWGSRTYGIFYTKLVGCDDI